MRIEYKCPKCRHILSESFFQAYEYKESARLQLRCKKGCGRMYKLQKNKPVLDLAWCDHDFLIKRLFSGGEPHPVHVTNFYLKHFNYLPRHVFNRSLEAARKKFERKIEEKSAKADKNSNPEQNCLFE